MLKSRIQSFRMVAVMLAIGTILPGAVLGGPAEDDFNARASSPGVVRAVSFDTANEVNTFVFPDGQFVADGSSFDGSLSASGGGSVRFRLPANSGSGNGGSLRINFSDAPFSIQFGENEEFYIQWRQRFDSAMLANKYTREGGGSADGWKTIIIGEGDVVGRPEVGSCTELELVTFNPYHAGFPHMYHSCVSFYGFDEPFGGSDFKQQNAMPAPYCLYSDSTKAGCFKFHANEWMTFQIRVKLGPRGTAFSSLERRNLTGFTNTTIQMWVAREGQPSRLVHDWSGVVLRESTGTKKYGKLWLLPYNTNRSSSPTFPVAHTWYDELIISRSRIPDPGVASVRPNAPQNFTVR